MPSVSIYSPAFVPLRERCKVNLSVDTKSKQRRDVKRNEPPVHSLLDVPVDPDSPHHYGESPVKSGLYASILPNGKDRCLGEIIPGMFVSFHEPSHTSAQVVHANRCFTHVVSISYSNDPGRIVETSTWFKDGSHVRALHLTLPFPSSKRNSPRLQLQGNQIRVARDFLSLALPYSSESAPPDWARSSSRVLIATPSGQPVDAICVAAAYLGFASGEEVCDVLSEMEDIAELPREWKRVVCEHDAETVQYIAHYDY
ncbi:hypothetical protein BDM02DRAFT_3186229 [Thelephora ganbajun]|uniref:Uncharacterized protein n=1 Tax=Thelephora ganbajun TaxID=370292 RepID=A0ACB6ZJ70_THEGA|nr:hypothetical protein BDM02DRAFT_3186229 [Thelephora ganbajun]